MTWPLVDPNDSGIRFSYPEGCFYCRKLIGQPHGAECVCVTKRIEMRVIANLPTGEVLTGLWQYDEPHSWDVSMSEFHKNQGSWCSSNFLNATGVTWDPGAEGAMEKLEPLHTDKTCLCGQINGKDIIRFEFLRVVDNTPRRELGIPEQT